MAESPEARERRLAYNRRYGKANEQRINEQRRARRRESPESPEAREHRLAYHREWYHAHRGGQVLARREHLRTHGQRPRDPEKHRLQQAEYRLRHPERITAHLRLAYAVRSGRVSREPCGVCGNPRSHAHHHKGYAPEQWFDVIWLCAPHHGEVHRTEAIP